MLVEMKHVRKSYGAQTVLADFSMSVQEGEAVCIMGASGAGKTTLLSLLAGLEKPDGGVITGVRDRKISMVFQEDRLLEWADAFTNVELALGKKSGRLRESGPPHEKNGRLRGDRLPHEKSRAAKTMLAEEHSKAQRKTGRHGKSGRAQEKKALHDFLRLEFEAVGLCDYEGKPVSELSGGMRRRVAIVRAVCAGGGLFLLDEPFTGLDERTKEQVIVYLKKRLEGRTVIMVTHDARDAERLGARIVACGAGASVKEQQN